MHNAMWTVVLMAVVLMLMPAVALVVPPAVVSLGIGSVAGAAGAAAVYPLDLIKTRLQSSSGAALYASGLDCTRDVYSSEGLGGFYRGVGTQVVGVAPEKTLKLFVNDAVRTAPVWGTSGLPVYGEVLAGFCAGLCQVVVTNPLEIVKVRLQLNGGKQGVLDVMKELGFGGLYGGAAATAVRDSTFSAVLFPLFAHARPAIAAALGPEHAGYASLIAGALAATPAALIATPADVVKTRMQQGSGLQRGGLPARDGGAGTARAGARSPVPIMTSRRGVAAAPADSMRSMAASIRKEEGIATFFDGSAERVMRSAPQFGVTLAVLDLLKASCEAHGWL